MVRQRDSRIRYLTSTAGHGLDLGYRVPSSHPPGLVYLLNAPAAVLPPQKLAQARQRSPDSSHVVNYTILRQPLWSSQSASNLKALSAKQIPTRPCRRPGHHLRTCLTAPWCRAVVHHLRAWPNQLEEGDDSESVAASLPPSRPVDESIRPPRSSQRQRSCFQATKFGVMPQSLGSRNISV